MEKDSIIKGHSKSYEILLMIMFLIVLLFVPWSKGLAHKVNIFAYVEEDTIFTESYFSDGRKCVHSKIEVFDNAGNKLLEGETDEAGEFSFKVPLKTDIKLVLTASMGHRAEYTIPLSELSHVIEKKIDKNRHGSPQQETSNVQPLKEKKLTGTQSIQMDVEQIQSIVENTLDKKLRPVMKLIAKSQEKRISFSEVVGGIGYIFGIMGIVMYLKSRRKE